MALTRIVFALGLLIPVAQASWPFDGFFGFGNDDSQRDHEQARHEAESRQNSRDEEHVHSRAQRSEEHGSVVDDREMSTNTIYGPPTPSPAPTPLPTPTPTPTPTPATTVEATTTTTVAATTVAPTPSTTTTTIAATTTTTMAPTTTTIAATTVTEAATVAATTTTTVAATTVTEAATVAATTTVATTTVAATTTSTTVVIVATTFAEGSTIKSQDALVAPVEAGTQTLTVAGGGGVTYESGQAVSIDCSVSTAPPCEYNEIMSTAGLDRRLQSTSGSIHLKTPLKYAHGKNAVIRGYAKTTTTTTTAATTTTSTAEAIIATTMESGEVIDYLQAPVNPGDDTIEVQNDDVYHKGQTVWIDPNNGLAESNTIVDKGSLKLKTPLKNKHAKNAVIHALPIGVKTTTPALTKTTTPASKYAGGVATKVAGVSNPLLIAGLFVSAAIIAVVVRLTQRKARRTREMQNYIQLNECQRELDPEGAME